MMTPTEARSKLQHLTAGELLAIIADHCPRRSVREAAGLGYGHVLGLYRITPAWGDHWFAWKVRIETEPGQFRLVLVTITRDRRLVAAETTTLDESARVRASIGTAQTRSERAG